MPRTRRRPSFRPNSARTPLVVLDHSGAGIDQPVFERSPTGRLDGVGDGLASVEISKVSQQQPDSVRSREHPGSADAVPPGDGVARIAKDGVDDFHGLHGRCRSGGASIFSRARAFSGCLDKTRMPSRSSSDEPEACQADAMGSARSSQRRQRTSATPAAPGSAAPGCATTESPGAPPLRDLSPPLHGAGRNGGELAAARVKDADSPAPHPRQRVEDRSTTWAGDPDENPAAAARAR